MNVTESLRDDSWPLQKVLGEVKQAGGKPLTSIEHEANRRGLRKLEGVFKSSSFHTGQRREIACIGINMLGTAPYRYLPLRLWLSLLDLVSYTVPHTP